MAMASRPKARVIVISRPMWSETHPQKGRHRPLTMRSAESAKVSAGIVSHNKWTGILSTLKSTAIGLSWATAIKPPVATIAIIRYMSQKLGVATISPDVKSTCDWRFFTSGLPFILQVLGIQPVGGDLRKNAATITVNPWMIPQRMNAAWYPAEAIMLAMGATVKADPAPKPAAVSPAANPRWSGNHFMARPIAVPYTMPAPIPATASE